MIEAIAARHLSMMSRHAVGGVATSVFSEPTITLIGSLDELTEVRRVNVRGREIAIDPVRRIADHGDHADPAIPFLHEGRWHLQIFLCGLDARDLPSEVGVETGGARWKIGAVAHRREAVREMTSRLVREGEGWVLRVEARGSTDVVIQESVFGRETERIVRLRGGSNEFEIPPSFSERLGLCVSTRDPFGGVEHKHLLYGEVGHASGRLLAIGRERFHPKQRHGFRYRSAIVVDDPRDPDAALAVVNAERYAETEIWCAPERAAALRAATAGNVRIRVTTFAPLSHPAAATADVLVVDPRRERPPSGRKASFLLFSDQGEPDFPDRMAAAIRACGSLPAEDHLLERAWLGAGAGPIAERIDHYGIGFSVSRERDPLRAVMLAKRLNLPERLACGKCRGRKVCDGLIATPWTSAMTPAAGLCGFAGDVVQLAGTGLGRQEARGPDDVVDHAARGG